MAIIKNKSFSSKPSFSNNKDDFSLSMKTILLENGTSYELFAYIYIFFPYQQSKRFVFSTSLSRPSYLYIFFPYSSRSLHVQYACVAKRISLSFSSFRLLNINIPYGIAESKDSRIAFNLSIRV